MINLYNKNLNQYARDNRCAGNLSEALLWNRLKKKQLGFDFTKQKPIGNYIADFYCKDLKLVIEIDGDTHEYKIDYDKQRDQYMKEQGIKVLRISDLDVKINMEGIVCLVKQTIADLSGTLPGTLPTHQNPGILLGPGSYHPSNGGE